MEYSPEGEDLWGGNLIDRWIWNPYPGVFISYEILTRGCENSGGWTFRHTPSCPLLLSQSVPSLHKYWQHKGTQCCRWWICYAWNYGYTNIWIIYVENKRDVVGKCVGRQPPEGRGPMSSWPVLSTGAVRVGVSVGRHGSYRGAPSYPSCSCPCAGVWGRLPPDTMEGSSHQELEAGGF